MNRIEEVKDRLEKATPGPWSRDYINAILGYGYAHITCADMNIPENENLPHETCDTEFIVHASEDIAWLLKRCETLEQVIRAEYSADGDLPCGVCVHYGKCSYDCIDGGKFEFDEKWAQRLLEYDY